MIIGTSILGFYNMLILNISGTSLSKQGFLYDMTEVRFLVLTLDNVTQSKKIVPNRTSGKIKLTPPCISTHHCTFTFHPKFWSSYSRLIVAGVNSR